MTEVISIAVSAEDQWLVVNGRPVEYYTGDTAFVVGRKVWASEVAAIKLGGALAVQPDVVDFATAGFPDAIVTLPSGLRVLVHGAVSLGQLGLDVTSIEDMQEDDLVILAHELIARARAKDVGTEAAPEALTVGA